MPDALSKTIPIWCTVINRFLFGHAELFLPREMVGASESAQILEKIDSWGKDLEVRNRGFESGLANNRRYFGSTYKICEIDWTSLCVHYGSPPRPHQNGRQSIPI